MIRTNKPVQLLEWGEGTNTLNQCWSEVAKGEIVSATTRDGLTTLSVEVKGRFEKRNTKDDYIKIAQQGEGMTPRSDKWGEVAMGRLVNVEQEGNESLVHIAIPTATKIGKARL